MAMNLRERVKGSLLNRDKFRLDTAVALLPQVEDARAFGEREEGVVSVSLWVLFALWNDRVWGEVWVSDDGDSDINAMTLRNIHDKINVWGLNQVSPRVARDYLHLRLWSYFQPSLNQAFFFFKQKPVILDGIFPWISKEVDGLVQLVAYLLTIRLQIHAFCNCCITTHAPQSFTCYIPMASLIRKMHMLHFVVHILFGAFATARKVRSVKPRSVKSSNLNRLL